jgi:hypothetical protein
MNRLLRGLERPPAGATLPSQLQRGFRIVIGSLSLHSTQEIAGSLQAARDLVVRGMAEAIG